MASHVFPPPPAIKPPAARTRTSALADESPREAPAAGRAAPRADTPAVALARFIYRLRRCRQELFGGALFSEPAWDILLELYVAGHEGRRISVSGACEAAAVPQTTGLRWLNQLEAQNMVTKRTDPRDARRAHVRLTPQAIRKMDELLNDVLALNGADAWI